MTQQSKKKCINNAKPIPKKCTENAKTSPENKVVCEIWLRMCIFFGVLFAFVLHVFNCCFAFFFLLFLLVSFCNFFCFFYLHSF